MKRLPGGLLTAVLSWTAFLSVDSLPPVAAAAGQDLPATLVLVWDAKGQVLQAIDPGSGTRLGSANVRAESIVVSRDGSRLVAFWTEPRTQIAHATVLDRRSLRTLGDVPMGRGCYDWFQTSDGRYLAATCWTPRKSRKDPERKHLLGIDLANGTLAGKLPIPGETTLMDGGNGRVLILSRRFASEPVNSVIASSLPALKDPARLDLPCGGTARRELLTRDRRRLFVRCDSERPLPKDIPATPSSMLIVDPETMAPPRVLPLGDDVFGDWSLSDSRFIYVNSNAGEVRPDVEPALILFSIEKERVTERVPLSRDAYPVSTRVGGSMRARTGDNTFLVRSSSRLLVIRDGRVLSTTDLPGKEPFASFTESPDGRRLYVTRERTVVALDSPTGAAAWTNTIKSEGMLDVSPDGTRALTRQGDNVTLIDLANGTTLAEFKASTGGARAGLFWKDLGLSFVSGALGGPYVNSATSSDVAFSTMARRAMLMATTGEVMLLDLADGRTVARLPGRAAALVALPESPLVLVVSPRQVVIFDMTSAKDVQRLSFPDAPGDMPPHIRVSKDGATLAVGAGSTVYFLERVSGRLVSRAGNLGTIAHVMFLE